MHKVSDENRKRALNPQHPYRKSRLGCARLEADMVSMCINVLYNIIKKINCYVNFSKCIYR